MLEKCYGRLDCVSSEDFEGMGQQTPCVSYKRSCNLPEGDATFTKVDAILPLPGGLSRQGAISGKLLRETVEIIRASVATNARSQPSFSGK